MRLDCDYFDSASLPACLLFCSSTLSLLSISRLTFSVQNHKSRNLGVQFFSSSASPFEVNCSRHLSYAMTWATHRFLISLSSGTAAAAQRESSVLYCSHAPGFCWLARMQRWNVSVGVKREGVSWECVGRGKGEVLTELLAALGGDLVY